MSIGRGGGEAANEQLAMKEDVSQPPTTAFTALACIVRLTSSHCPLLIAHCFTAALRRFFPAGNGLFPYKDGPSLYKDEASLYKDEASLYKDEPSLYKDEASLYKDEPSLYKDEALAGLMRKGQNSRNMAGMPSTGPEKGRSRQLAVSN
jgi:hypothetical protein